MRLRFVLPALIIGAGFLSVQTPADAKSYKSYKVKKFKGSKRFKNGKQIVGHKVSKHKAPKH
jgi:hypothetical protein